jgi:hypothetical protein
VCPVAANADSNAPLEQTWLAPDEFQKVFGMSREEFAKMPGWKQKQKKDEKDLF